MNAELLLDGLDAEQRIVAEALSGPVCVLAGAGTGKTRALTHRVAYGVAVGAYDPSRVLALTFTARAAGELRERLRQLVKPRTTEGETVAGTELVAARTFHATALAQLNHFWPTAVGGRAPSILASKGRLLAEAADSLRLKVDTAALRDVASEIEWAKVTLTSEADHQLKLAATAPAGLTASSYLDLASRYEALKTERRSIDFEDVLLITAGMLEVETRIAQQVRERYRHFVVDEYQDISPAQQRLLKLWLGERDELCVVGDASQTIYSFTGATPKYLLEFPERYPDSSLVRLVHNYRSTRPILDWANRLMCDQPGALMLRASESSSTGGSGTAPSAPNVSSYSSDKAEAVAVAEAVQERLDAGVPSSKIAVLVRVNAQTQLIERAFDELRIGSRLLGGPRFFERPEVRQAIMALRASARTDDGARPAFQAVTDVLRSLGWSARAPESPGALRDRFEALDSIARLVDEEPEESTLASFAESLAQRAQHNDDPPLTSVTLATIHSAKGLEWDEVFIAGANEGYLPISYAKSIEAIDEERRLFYVGITRARQRLSVSWVAQGRQPSRFLAEIDNRIEGVV